MYYCIAETVCEQGEQSLNHQSTNDVAAAVSVVSNPVHFTSEDNDLKDNYTKKRYFSVQIITTGEKSFDHLNMDCPVVSNPIASEHDASTEDNDHYTESEEPHSVSIPVEAPQSIDQQSADNQDATSEYHSNPEDNLTDSKDTNSVATISSVHTTAEKYHLVESCGPQQVTSPYGSLTKDSLIGYKRYTCSYMQAYS